MKVTHARTAIQPDKPGSDRIQPGDWNADHVVELEPGELGGAIEDGSIATVKLGGDVTAVAKTFLTAANQAAQRAALALAAIAASGSGADLGAATVALSKIADVANSVVLGRVDPGPGPVQALTTGQLSTLMFLAQNAKAYGALGDDVADDRAALIATIAAAKAAPVKALLLPDGTYKASSYLDVADVHGLHILGQGNARIRYGSDDLAIQVDSIATSTSMARAAIILRYTSDVTISNVTFIGGLHPDIQRNTGPGVYASTGVTGTTLENCNQLGGDCLIQHDASVGTKGTGDTLTFNPTTGYVTLFDATGNFKPGHGTGSRYITIVGATNPDNNGVFRIVSYTSATTIVIENAAGVTEPSLFAWRIDDHNRKLRVIGGRSFAHRGAITPTNDSVIFGHTFEHPDTYDVVLLGGSFAISGTTVTYSVPNSKATTDLIGKWIKIAGATTPGNNGWFQITGLLAQSAFQMARISYTNASGATEAHPGTGWVPNGEKVGTGSGALLAIETGTCTIATSDIITRAAHGYRNGTNVRFTTTGSLSGTGLTPGVDYYVIYIDANTFKVATTPALAASGTPRDITAVGSGTHSVTSGVTMTSLQPNSFHPIVDFNKTIRIIEATSSNNNGSFSIQNATASTVTYNDFAVTVEAFSGYWTIDGWDRCGGSTNGTGASHFVYMFAGRSDIDISACTFLNCRKSAVKISGSTIPITNINVHHNRFYQCGNGFVAGADDSMEHNNILFADNILVDCGVGRTGWTDSIAVQVIGCRGVTIRTPHLYYTQNAVGSVNGDGISGNTGIDVGRYLPSTSRADSQPMEGVLVDGPVFSGDPDQTTSNGILVTCVSASAVGMRTYWATAGTLTKEGGTFTAAGTLTRASHGYQTGVAVQVSTTGALPSPLAASTDYYVIRVDNNTFQLALTQALALAGTAIVIADAGTGTHTVTNKLMTLTDASSAWSRQMAGQTMEIVNAADAANNGTFKIAAVTSTTTLTFENASGVGGAVVAGTYRIFPAEMNSVTWLNAAAMGGIARLRNVTSFGIGTLTVQTTRCVAPSIIGTTWAGSGGGIKCSGDVAPYIEDSIMTGGGTSNAHIQLVNVSWPIIGTRNRVANSMHFATTSAARDMTIGIATTVVDHPLQGTRGRMRPSDGYEEVVFPYGDGFVDGDILIVNTTTFTYKLTSPAAGTQFNSAASLITAINTTLGATVLAADYGSRLAIPTAADIGHIHIRRLVRSTSDAGGLHVRSRTLNATALPVLRNHQQGTPTVSYCYGRGAAAAGTIPNKAVVWSPLAGHTSSAVLVPDNDVSVTLLSAGVGAQGLITCVAKVSMADTDFIQIGDGINPIKRYDFDTVGDGDGDGGVVVNISGASSAIDVAAILRTAILANQPAISVTDNGNGTLTLAHNWPGTGGNVAIAESVANAGFTVAGMVNGGPGGYRQLRNSNDGGCCALIQLPKTTNQANVDVGAEFRWVL